MYTCRLLIGNLNYILDSASVSLKFKAMKAVKEERNRQMINTAYTDFRHAYVK